MLQLLDVDFYVHERPCPDRPKESELGILAVKSLIQHVIS